MQFYSVAPGRRRGPPPLPHPVLPRRRWVRRSGADCATRSPAGAP